MEFDWSDEQLELHRSVIQFARTSLGRDVRKRDLECEFPTDDWQKCAQFGIQGMLVPEPYGGRGLDLLTYFLAMEGLGYACRDNGLTFALGAQSVSVVQTLVAAGSDSQKRNYLPGTCNGKLIGAYAMTEPAAGSDAFSLQTTCTKIEDGWLLNGAKCFVTFAPVADYFLVFATSDPSLGHWGVSLFIVDRESAGLEVSETQPKMGLRTTPIGDLRLRDCRVPETALVGQEGAGAAIFNAGQDYERTAVLASQLGAMQFQIERTVEYARARKQFGQPIGHYQSVANRIADMKIRLESARLLGYKAAWRLQRGLAATLDAAIANVAMAEAFVQSSIEQMATFGGRGYMTETEVERDLRDAMGGPVYGGTSDIQRHIIARQLGL